MCTQWKLLLLCLWCFKNSTPDNEASSFLPSFSFHVYFFDLVYQDLHLFQEEDDSEYWEKSNVESDAEFKLALNDNEARVNMDKTLLDIIPKTLSDSLFNPRLARQSTTLAVSQKGNGLTAYIFPKLFLRSYIIVIICVSLHS